MSTAMGKKENDDGSITVTFLGTTVVIPDVEDKKLITLLLWMLEQMEVDRGGGILRYRELKKNYGLELSGELNDKIENILIAFKRDRDQGKKKKK